METFRDYAFYYNAFYKDKDYEKEAKQVDYLLQYYGKNVHKIVNFGCGTGKHDIELAKMGYQCEGIDISASMIDIARKNAEREKVNIPFSTMNIQDFNPLESYDAVISLFHVMSYQNENSDVMKTFAAARRALNHEGLFLFDVWYGPGVLSDRPCVRVKEVKWNEDQLMRIARPTMYDKKNVVQVDYTILVMDQKSKETQIIKETHNMRYFFRPELEFMLHESGFELISNLDCVTLGETDLNSWTSFFVAKAI